MVVDGADVAAALGYAAIVTDDDEPSSEIAGLEAVIIGDGPQLAIPEVDPPRRVALVDAAAWFEGLSDRTIAAWFESQR